MIWGYHHFRKHPYGPIVLSTWSISTDLKTSSMWSYPSTDFPSSGFPLPLAKPPLMRCPLVTLEIGTNHRRHSQIHHPSSWDPTWNFHHPGIVSKPHLKHTVSTVSRRQHSTRKTGENKKKHVGSHIKCYTNWKWPGETALSKEMGQFHAKRYKLHILAPHRPYYTKPNLS